MSDAAEVAARPARTNALVLIVEDDPASRYGLASLLESEGYEVSEARQPSGSGGALPGQRHPAAIVLDITLPDGDGAVWLRERARPESRRFPP